MDKIWPNAASKIRTQTPWNFIKPDTRTQIRTHWKRGFDAIVWELACGIFDIHWPAFFCISWVWIGNQWLTWHAVDRLIRREVSQKTGAIFARSDCLISLTLTASKWERSIRAMIQAPRPCTSMHILRAPVFFQVIKDDQDVLINSLT